MSKWVDHIFSLPAWLAVLVVFVLPAAEASIFLGFILPGEIAVVLGGVLAFQGKVPLPVILVAAIAGAVIGDSIGYFVGRRWGRGIIDGTFGHFINADHINKGERLLAEKGAYAVFLGRWTATLRAFVPGLAGMSKMQYRKFLVWNFLGGALWATTFVLLGHAAGNSYRKLEHQANIVSWIVLGAVIVLGTIAFFVIRARRRRVKP